MVFKKKLFFIIGMWNSRPPPFMEKTILNFHFDYLHTSLIKERANYDILCSHYKTLSKKQSGIYEVLGRELVEEGKDLSPRASLVSVFTSVGLLDNIFQSKVLLKCLNCFYRMDKPG